MNEHDERTLFIEPQQVLGDNFESVLYKRSLSPNRIASLIIMMSIMIFLRRFLTKESLPRMAEKTEIILLLSIYLVKDGFSLLQSTGPSLLKEDLQIHRYICDLIYFVQFSTNHAVAFYCFFSSIGCVQSTLKWPSIHVKYTMILAFILPIFEYLPYAIYGQRAERVFNYACCCSFFNKDILQVSIYVFVIANISATIMNYWTIYRRMKGKRRFEAGINSCSFPFLLLVYHTMTLPVNLVSITYLYHNRLFLSFCVFLMHKSEHTIVLSLIIFFTLTAKNFPHRIIQQCLYNTIYARVSTPSPTVNAPMVPLVPSIPRPQSVTLTPRVSVQVHADPMEDSTCDATNDRMVSAEIVVHKKMPVEEGDCEGGPCLTSS